MNRLVVAGRVATPVRSGGWLVDLGEAWPRWVAHRDDALDLLYDGAAFDLACERADRALLADRLD